ncbi:MAG: hypothetical protein D6732_20800 [Methanobacteriota archaeon]|nr:MAG: hypothetical protein D6732_20800 [Euryarchaeota archaeon]
MKRYTEVQIEKDPQINGRLYLADGRLGLILTHGERTDIDEPIFHNIAKDLQKKKVTTLLFRMPFKVKKKRIPDKPSVQEEVFLKVWQWVHSQSELADKKWAIGGHDIGAKAAIRSASMIAMQEEIPPVVALSFPLYPPNRPEKLQMDELQAIIGPVLFCQGDKGNQGTYDRLANQLAMMASFAELKLIKGADHNFNVQGREPHIVSKWISNDIANFLASNL